MKEGGPLQRAALLFAWQLQNVLFPVIFHSFVLDRLRREPDRRAASLAEVELENSPCVHTEFRNAYLGPGQDRGVAVGIDFGRVVAGRQKIEGNRSLAGGIGNGPEEPFLSMSADGGNVIARLAFQYSSIIPDGVDVIEEFQFRLVLAVGRFVIPVQDLQRAVVDSGKGQLVGGRGLDALGTGNAVGVLLPFQPSEILPIIADGIIRRAGHVWLLLDSRTEGLRGGEESRFVKQLELHFGARVTRCVLRAPISKPEEADSLPKTAEQLEELHRHNLSASSLENYLVCPAKFYYAKVCGLRDEDEVRESLEANDIGTVFHGVMEELYTVEGAFVSRDYLKQVLSGGRIPALVRRRVLEKLNGFELAGRNIVFADMIVRYVRQAVLRDIEYLEKQGVEGFRILGLELERYATIGGFRFRGVLDRLDSIRPGELRVLDYKTGRVTDEDFLIDEGNAEAVVEALFGDSGAKRPKIALQLYLYDRYIADDPAFRGWTLQNSVYQPARLFIREVENVSLSRRFLDLMDGRLADLLAEISDLEKPWRRTQDTKSCAWCDFKNICGR